MGTVPSTHLPGSSRVTPMLGLFICGWTFAGTPTIRSRLTEPRSRPLSPS